MEICEWVVCSRMVGGETMYFLAWKEDANTFVVVGAGRQDKEYVQHEADMLNENHVGKVKM